MGIRSLVAACLSVWSVIAAGLILSTLAMAADSSRGAKVSVTHAEWVGCGNDLGIKMSLQVELKNPSQEPLVVGRVEVAQERFYRKGEENKLELLGTTNTPDEFVAPDAADIFADIRETKVSGNTSKAFTVIHYAYISSAHIRYDADAARVIASFHVTNVRRDGSASGYWSDPVTITLPRNCKVAAARTARP